MADVTYGQPVQLQEENPEQKPIIILDSGPSTVLPDPGVASLRASQAHWGVSPMYPELKYEDYFHSFSTGKEDELRDHVTNKLNNDMYSRVNNAVSELANRQGGAISLEEYDQVRSAFKPVVPQTVFEEAFAGRYIDSLHQIRNIEADTNVPKFDWLQRLIQFEPYLAETLRLIKEKATAFAATQNIIDKLTYEKQQQQEEQSTFQKVLNFVKPMAPGYTDVQLRGNIPGAGVTEGIFTGENMEAQRHQIFSVPLDQREELLREATKNLTPEMAVQFLTAMRGQSSNDKFLNDVFPALDLTALGSVARLGLGATRAGLAVRDLNKFNNGYKNLITNSENLKLKPTNVAIPDAVGDMKEAAIQEVTSQQAKVMAGEGLSPVDQAMEESMPIFSPTQERMKANPGGFGGDNTNKIVEQMDAGRRSLFQKVQDVMKIRRIPAVLALESVIRNIMEESKKLYRGVDNQIVGSSNMIWNDLTNNHGFYFFFGDENGEAFRNPLVAKTWAQNRGWEGIEVVDVSGSQGIVYPENSVIPKGAGHLVAKWIPIRENEDIIRKALMDTKEVQSPFSWMNSISTWIRTPEETLSAAERKNRGIAEFVPQALLKEVKRNIKDIKAVARGTFDRKTWKEWERAVKYSQHAPDPETKIPGYWYSPGELDDFYQRTFQRLPSEKEYRAYYAVQRAYDDDYILRNLRIHSDMNRLGAEHHEVWWTPAKGQDTVKSGWFVGIKMNHLPLGDDSILVFDGQGGKKQYYGNETAWRSAKARLEDGVASGSLKVVRVYDPDLGHFERWAGNARVRYVISPVENFSEKKLPLFNLPRRGGGHFIYDYDYWISQAKIKREILGKAEDGSERLRHTYIGDANLAGLQIRAMGAKYVQHLNKVRELIRDNQIDAARDYNNAHLDIDFDTHYGWYQPKKDPKGFDVAPRFDKNEPFFVRHRGQNAMKAFKESLQARYAELKDGTLAGSDARQNVVEFAAERDAHEMLTVKDEGSKNTPIFKTAPAETIDPIAALNRGLSRIVQSFVMDDYKHFAVEHWIEEGIKKGIFKTNDKEIRYSPLAFFTRPEYQSGLQGEALQVQKQMEANRWKIQQFLGVQDKVSTFIHNTTQKLVDEIYGAAGPKLTPTWLLPWMGSGNIYGDIRSLVFHAKLGLFNVPQFFKQFSTYANVIGMAGWKYAAPSAAATLFHQWGRISPHMIEEFDRRLASLHLPGSSRWKLGEFKESWQLAERSGFLDGVHSHINLDAPLANEVIQSRWGTFLNWGSVFFREGANNTKIASWHTAFKEWRDAHPTGPISQADAHEIFLKARTYNHNMDRASASSFQTGLLSFSFQFKSYTLRLAELMTGKRLTPVQKARLFVTHSALYGVPLSAGLYGLPVDDLFRPVAVNSGYVPKDDVISTMFMEGGLSTAVAFVNGGFDLKKGKLYDFGQQFGPVGFTELTNHTRTDSPMLDLVLGAAGSTFGDALKTADPMWVWLSNHFKGKGNEEITPDDVLTAAKHMLNAGREASSVNRAWNYLIALETAKWFSKSGAYLGDTNFWDASFMTLFGLQPSDVAGFAAAGEHILSQREEMHKQAESRFKSMYRNSLRALAEGDVNNSNSYIKLAFAALAFYPPELQTKLIASIVSENQNLVDRVADRLYLQGSGLSLEQQDILLRAYQRRSEVNNGR